MRTTRRRRYKRSEIITVLEEHANGMPVQKLVEKHGVSDASIYAWRKKFKVAGNHVVTVNSRNQPIKITQLQEENRKLRKILISAMLEIVTLRETLELSI